MTATGPTYAADQDVTVLMNIGPAVRRRLERVGITEVGHLTGRDPFELYERMCDVDQQRHDPCLLDTLMSAVDQAEGGPAKPWWHYTPERRRRLAGASAPGGL